ncbi:E3 ubiquitin-protein ligase pub2 [Astathelohania contejeani]|uniref:E3 ubiquitin-protein ligase pub2 n=1 Tax=Astathelohania contejeani TaxID=164912 RepID=A0ABQ7HXF9_9MICR|nr:E3 ubiquitin-protein ligase pub2 [Thelohania contejeani]
MHINIITLLIIYINTGVKSKKKKKEAEYNKNWFNIFHVKGNKSSIEFIPKGIEMMKKADYKETQVYFGDEKDKALFFKTHALNLCLKCFKFNNTMDKWLTIMGLEFIRQDRFLFSCINKRQNIYDINIFEEFALEFCIKKDLIMFGHVLGLMIKQKIFLPFRLPFYFCKLMLDIPIEANDVLVKNSILTRGLNNIKKSLWKLKKNSTEIEYKLKIIKELRNFDLEESCHVFKKVYSSKKSFKELKNMVVEYLIESVKSNMSYVKQGVNEVINENAINDLTVVNLDSIINGASEPICLEYLKNHTSHVECTINTDIVAWFWEHIKKHYKNNKFKEIFFLLTGLKYVSICSTYRHNTCFYVILDRDITDCSMELFSKKLYLPIKLNEELLIKSLKKLIDLLYLEYQKYSQDRLINED